MLRHIFVRHAMMPWFFRYLPIVLPGLLTIGLVVAIKAAGLFQGMELSLWDWGMRWRLGEAADERVVILGIDEEDLRQVGYPITDQTLAGILAKLQQYQPRAIGIDIFRDLPVEPGYQQLKQALRQMPNVIGIEKAVLPDRDNPVVYASPDLPAEQVGFGDVLVDGDGNVRRALLSSPGWDGRYRFSLATRLADRYLQKSGILLGNGRHDRHAFQFGSVELPRFTGNEGGYVRTDQGGNQILLNWRRRSTFRRLSLREFQSGNFGRQLLHDRIVLIGYTAPYSAKDTFLASAVQLQEIFGLEYHAHTISQILSTVLDGRPFLGTLWIGWEYVWIILWGSMGIALALSWRSPLQMYGRLIAGGIFVIILHSGLLQYHYWIPIVPVLFAWAGTTLITRNVNDFRSFLAQQQQLLDQQQLVLIQRQQLIDQQQLVLEQSQQLIDQQQLVLEQRQSTLEDAFNAMHNGPLHTLAEMISILKTDNLDALVVMHRLQGLDTELRTVYETLRPENLERAASTPLHELLYEVFHHTMQRDFACFRSLKVRVPDIHPLQDTGLSGETKRELCAFLEEALCNVGKHAEGATRLIVTCKPENGKQLIRIIDNGIGISPETIGDKSRGGTKHAHKLAKQLHGSFQRRVNHPQGTICEFLWET